MKKGLIFFLGIVVGCILTIAALFVIGTTYSNTDESDITIAEQQKYLLSQQNLRFFKFLGMELWLTVKRKSIRHHSLLGQSSIL